jgi:hypothetical protein
MYRLAQFDAAHLEGYEERFRVLDLVLDFVDE